jgi:hypothetical protein
MIQSKLNPHLSQQSDNSLYMNSIKFKPLSIAFLDNFPYPNILDCWMCVVCEMFGDCMYLFSDD